MRKALSRYGIHALTLSAIVILSLGVAAYITAHQRLHFPWEDRVEIIAEFSTGQSVTPGHGATPISIYFFGLPSPDGIVVGADSSSHMTIGYSPAEAHAEQLSKYTDEDIHNLMAYIQTLR